MLRLLGKTLLLMIPYLHALVEEQGEVRLKADLELSSNWPAFLVLEGAL